MTRSDLYQALRSATEGEFDLLGELDADAGWMAYLAQAPSGELAILLLHATDAGGEFDLQVVEALVGSLAVGKTHCPACGAAADGWPRFCGACRRDLSGVAADAAVPGDSAEELLQSVREASNGVYEVLGAMRHTEGGGAMHFAREMDGGRIAGLVLERDGADLSLVRSWGADEEALARPAPFAAAVPVPAPVPADPVPAADPVSAYVPSAPVPTIVAPVVPGDPPPVWTDEPPPRDKRRAPRPLLHAVGGGLVVAAMGAAALALTRGGPPTVAPTAVVDSLRVSTAPAVPPARIPAWGLADSAAATPADTPQAANPTPAAPTKAAEPPRRRPDRPRTQATVQAPPVEPVPVAPSPEADRQGVMEAVARYASAVQSRDLDRVRAAYPGISGEEVERWDAWFRRFGPGTQLRVTHAISQGPEVSGDEATVVFTLLMRYQGQRHPVTSRATLRRAGDGWALQALQAPE